LCDNCDKIVSAEIEKAEFSANLRRMLFPPALRTS